MAQLEASGIARPLDPEVASNHAVVVGALAAGTLTLAARAMTRRSSPLGAAAASTEACFGAWAIARELDPDEQSSAIIAMPLALVGRVFGRPGLGATFATLIATRLAAGTVGGPLRPADAGQIAALGLVAGSRAAGWPAVPALAIGLARDGGLGERTAIGLTGAMAGGLAGALLARARPRPASPSWPRSAWLAATAGAGALSFPVRAVESRTDMGGRPIEPRRVALARAISLVTALGGGLLDGRRGVAATAPIAAALLGTACTRVAALGDAPRDGPSASEQPPRSAQPSLAASPGYGLGRC